MNKLTVEESNKIKHEMQNEKIVIGLMFQDEKVAINGCKMLKEKYFCTEYAAYIFRLIKASTESGKGDTDICFRIKSITNEDWKRLFPHIDYEGQNYVNDCIDSTSFFIGSESAAEAIIKQIQDQYRKRTLLAKVDEMQKDLRNTAINKNCGEILNKFTADTNNILDEFITIDDETYKEMGLRVLNAKETSVISTGFSQLDTIIQGFRPGQLVTVGGGTGVGKSAFAVNLALNISSQGHKIGFWAFEMDEEEIFQRIFSIKTGYPENDESLKEERYNSARKYIDNAKEDIKIVIRALKDLDKFYLECRRLVIKEKMKIVIIDYLQLIRLDGEGVQNRVLAIENITTRLKNIASELGITIVILSQFSRDYQKRENKKPILSDLRQSGSIEQDSNIVILLHKSDELVNTSKTKTLIEIIVAKNRSGRCGSFLLKYNGDLTKFIEKEEK